MKVKIIFIISIIWVFNVFSQEKILETYSFSSIIVTNLNRGNSKTLKLDNAVLNKRCNLRKFKKRFIGEQTAWTYSAGWDYTFILIDDSNKRISLNVNLDTKQAQLNKEKIFDVESLEWLNQIVPDSICDVVKVKTDYIHSQIIFNKMASDDDIFIDYEDFDSLSMNTEGHFCVDSLSSFDEGFDAKKYLIEKYPGFVFDLEISKDYNQNTVWFIQSNKKFYDLFTIGNIGRWEKFGDVELIIYGDKKRINEFLNSK